MFKREVFSDHIKITDSKFDVDFYEKFEESKKYTLLYDLASLYGKLPTYKRKALLFGNADLQYSVTYRGKTSIRKVTDWNNLSDITEIKDKIKIITGMDPTVCILQWYPNGKIGIDAHRDKEMKPGTKIAGVSFESNNDNPRILSFSNGKGSIKFPLTSGSLYVMNPPTNDMWTHSIQCSESANSRISLTFRDY